MVLVDKEIAGQVKRKRKAWLCMRGVKEENVEKIPEDTPSVSKININLMFAEVVRQGWEINLSDIARAFLQTRQLIRMFM